MYAPPEGPLNLSSAKLRAQIDGSGVKDPEHLSYDDDLATGIKALEDASSNVVPRNQLKSLTESNLVATRQRILHRFEKLRMERVKVDAAFMVTVMITNALKAPKDPLDKDGWPKNFFWRKKSRVIHCAARRAFRRASAGMG